jgi:hypothetical protein
MLFHGPRRYSYLFSTAATYKEVSMPVIKHYEAQHKVAEAGLRSLLQLLSLIRLPYQIDSSPSPEEVHTVAIAAVKRVLI